MKSAQFLSSPSLSIDGLRYFLASIEFGSFQAAAEYLHVSPQAVGKAIANLEGQLGPLIVRDRRLRGLTPAGSALASEAKNLLAALDELAERVAPPDRSRPAGPVAVGGTNSVCQYILPAVCARLLADHPRVRPQLLAMEPDAMERRLLAGELDFGVVATPPTRAGLEAEPGPDAPSVIVAAGCEPGHWRDFGYIVPRVPEGSGEAIDGWPTRGYPRRIVAETNQLEVAIRLAEAGLGATVIPLVCVLDRLAAGSLAIVASPPVAIVHRLWVTWPTGQRRSPAALALADELAAWQLADHGFLSS
ncbi:MAG: LysR family transcriptional regulator [Vulcanimicrobiota bacterium]